VAQKQGAFTKKIPSLIKKGDKKHCPICDKSKIGYNYNLAFFFVLLCKGGGYEQNANTRRIFNEKNVYPPVGVAPPTVTNTVKATKVWGGPTYRLRKATRLLKKSQVNLNCNKCLTPIIF